MGRPVVNLQGKRFGRLLVADFYAREGSQTKWLCQCDCGNTVIAGTGNLRSGSIQSCGCLRKELAREKVPKAIAACMTHGMRHTRIYRIWSTMLIRCNNPRSKAYAAYGGAGIEVCERWRQFENFVADMGEPPSMRHTLDRIDNDGNYEPGNCRWATWEEQQRNRTNNLMVTAFGQTKPLVSFMPGGYTSADNEYFYLRKLVKKGWDVEAALIRVFGVC